MLQSLPRRHSGVVTKWIPLFKVHVTAVGWGGSGAMIPVMRITARGRDNLEQRGNSIDYTSNKNFAMSFDRPLLRLVLLDLFRMFVLHRTIT
jgi:hypothetical protein